MARTAAAKADLSRSAIVERALTIADEEGLVAVTIRRIAQEFGVTPMALYWHVSNKDELLAAMGESFFDDLDIPVRQPWGEDLRAIMEGLVAALRKHPASAPLAAQRIMSCEAGQLLTERAFGLLRGAGFSIVQTADIGRTALQTAVMLVTSEAGSELEVPAGEREAHLQAKLAALNALPPARFPNLLACAEALTDCADVQAYYDFGIDLFVTGVEQLGERVSA